MVNQSLIYIHIYATHLVINTLLYFILSSNRHLNKHNEMIKIKQEFNLFYTNLGY